MQSEMDKLKQQIEEKTKSGSSKDAFQQPENDRKTAAKTLAKPKNPTKNPPKPVEESEPGLAAPASEAAKRARLRRLCERKPSGRIFVPEEVHTKWKNANSDERDAMVEVLEANNWSKDQSRHCFLFD